MSQPVTSEAARSLINGVLPMHSRKPDRIFIARPIRCFFCFLASLRNGNFNGVCADFGNFFVAWHVCSVRHPLAGNNFSVFLGSGKNYSSVVENDGIRIESEYARPTRNSHQPASTTPGRRRPIASFRCCAATASL